DEPVDHDLEPGLLHHLTHDGLVQGLPRLHPPAGQRPQPRAGPVTPADAEQPSVVDGEGAHGHLGPRGHAPPPASDGSMASAGSPSGADSSPRYIVRLRATNPCSSKKFLAARWPGNAVASMPSQRWSRHQSTSTPTSASPTPTSRASGSTNSSVTLPTRPPSRSSSTSTMP